MSSHIGPTRLIAIRSGKYDYGEIDLTEPVHLVGPNNVGKTSLIALLQLLYVDSQNHMSFSRPMDESKRYYFPDTSSYVLFEVLTPTGYQVLGVHGLGKIKRNDFERFSYQGKFDRADFLDENRMVRENKEIRARLVDRQYTSLEPKHLRAALTGLGNNKGVNLGLVPLRHRDHYPRFRTVFQYLLKLSQLRQKELKNLLLDLYRGDFRQLEIVLAKDMSENLHIIRKGQAEISKLTELRPGVVKLVEYASTRGKIRRTMPSIWSDLGRASTLLSIKLSTEAKTLAKEQQEAGREEEDLRNRIKELESRRETTTRRMALSENEKDQLEKERTRFAGFILEFKQQERLDLQKKLDALVVRLHAGRSEKFETVDHRRNDLLRTRKQLALRLENLVDSAGKKILALLPDDDKREDFFKLLDAGLLGLPWGDGGFEVTDDSSLEKWLNDFQKCFTSSGFQGNGVRINLESLPAPDLEQYVNAERITLNLAGVDRDIERCAEILESIEEQTALESRRDQLQGTHDDLGQEIADWKKFQKMLDHEPTLLAEMKELNLVQAEQVATNAKIMTDLGELKDREHTLLDLIAGVEEARVDMNDTMAALQPPDPGWFEMDEDGDVVTQEKSESDSSLSFADYALRYKKSQDSQIRFDERVKERLRNIEERTYGKYPAAAEKATILALQEQIDALPHREAAIQEMWRTLSVDLRSSFKALWQDLEILKGRVDVLNRQLGKVTISNLQRVRLIIEERREWGGQIRDMLDFDDMPLFTDPKKAAAAIDDVAKLLDQHERVHLSDLFGFRFEITTTDGQTKRYQNLDNIESNGTTITIKVLINVLLLRELLNRDEVKIPYYLDEASSLDQDNLTAIVDYSRNRGFIPVLASPDPMEAAGHLYFISEVDGRVVLDPEYSLVKLAARQNDSTSN